jgi:DNA-binding phage protein
MTKMITTPYDVAEHLRTPEESAAYLEACLEEANGDAAFIAKALGDIARAKALSGEKNPNFDIILKIMGALGTPVSC